MPRRITILAALIPSLWLGCSDSPPVPTQDKEVHSQPADAVADANRRIAFAVEQAKIHRDFKEFDAAEKLLTEALADPDATEKDAALQLLRQVKLAAQQETAATTNTAVAPLSATGDESQRAVLPATDAKQPQEQPPPVPAKPVVSLEPSEDIVIELELPPQPVDPAKLPAATDAQVAAAITEAGSQLSAEAAVGVLQDFAKFHQLTEQQQQRLEEQRTVFQARADQGLVRNGKEWISVDESKKRESEADQKIEQALTLLGVQNVKAAIDYLKDASEIDRNSIRPDFTLGQIYSIVGFYEAASAVHHFKRVLTRSPKHICALNNLALAEVKQREFSAALSHWKMASEIAPNAPEIVHNLGRVVSKTSAGKLPIEPTLLRRFTKLYAELATGEDAPESSRKVGWLYMPLILPKGEQDRPAGEPDNSLASFRCTGTGFVVHDNYIVTNKHVILHDEFGPCDRVTILDPNDPATANQLTAEVVQKAVNVDLAVLRCPELKLPPIPTKAELPERGSPILVLGYPWASALGTTLKLTQGIVTSLPDKVVGSYILTDAEINHGNSGGPICDDRGNVIAVATMFVTADETFMGKLGGGIPASYVNAFLSSSIAGYKPPVPNDGPKREWTDVDKAYGPSTLLITCEWRGATMNLPKANTATANYLEDHSCSVCSGLSVVPCPQKRCVGGTVSKVERVYRETNPINGQKFYTNKVVKVSCPTCRGKGTVSCPACKNGLDPSLLVR